MTDDTRSQPSPDSSIGSVLAGAREERGLSVEDVAAATRIRAQLIGEIERDEFDSCGGAIYARGHIRAIAHLVGADGDELVARFDRSHGGTPAQQLDPAALPKLAGSTDRDIAHARRTSPRWATAAVAVLAVGAIFLGVTWFAGRGGDSPTRTADGPVPAATTTTTPPPSPSPSPSPTTPSPTPTPSVRPGVSVQVHTTDGNSWVQVLSGTGDELFAQVMDTGQTMQWHDPRSLTIRFGNAHAVEVTVNGRDLGAPCTRTVCTVQFPGTAAAG